MTQILFKNIDMKGLTSIGVYEKQGGYQSLKKAFAKKPEEIIEIVKSSGLRGRGGAGPRRSPSRKLSGPGRLPGRRWPGGPTG